MQEPVLSGLPRVSAQYRCEVTPDSDILTSLANNKPDSGPRALFFFFYFRWHILIG